MNMEIDPDDTEHVGVDAGMGDGDDDGQEQEPTIAKPGKRDLIVNLWPFAFSKEYYKAIVEGFCGGERLSHIVVLSTSGHPAYALAAHDLRLTAHVHLDRVSGHSQAHGQQVLRDFLRQEFHVAEQARQALVAGGAKRIRPEYLAFIQVSAPPVLEQTSCFLEVPGDTATPAWRGSFNEFPSSDVLEAGVLELLQRELETFGLAVRPAQAGGRPVLVTEKARGEGDILCPVSCLLFGGANGLRECLNKAGNAALLDGPLIHVAGLRRPGGSMSDYRAADCMDAYGIPVGAARLVSDYQAAGRHHANTRIRTWPSRGPNDGFLVVLDFGAARIHIQEPTEPLTKRFKGALDALLFKQMAKANALAAEGEATPTAEGEACAQAAAPAAPAPAPAAPAPGPVPAGRPAAVQLAVEESFRLELQADDTHAIYSTTAGVTKIAARTILKVFDQGELEEVTKIAQGAAGMVKFQFQRCNAQARQAAWRVGLGSKGRAMPGYTRGQKRARERGRGRGGLSDLTPGGGGGASPGRAPHDLFGGAHLELWCADPLAAPEVPSGWRPAAPPRHQDGLGLRAEGAVDGRVPPPCGHVGPSSASSGRSR
jgi:hypothetical protein